MFNSGEKAAMAEYQNCFEKLNLIVYKDIYINGICMRILGIHFMDFGPEWSVNRHKHSFFEFHYVTDHNVYTTINCVEYKVGAGSFYIMPPDTFHSHRQNPGEHHTGFALRWEIINDNIANMELDNSFLQLEKINESLLIAHSQPVEDNGTVIKDMIRLLDMAGQGSAPVELQLEFIQMIISISKFYLKPRIPSDFNVQSYEDHIVNNAARFIEENYAQEIDMNDVSSTVHLSYSHLSRLFKKYTGSTIIQYLNQVRLKRAQHLIMCSNKKMAQVALEVGFNNEYYFCNMFKKFYGVSPGSYRKGKSGLTE